MCVIIAKARGLALPESEMLRKAFQANSDGFGLAYHHEGERLIHILKGAMTFPQSTELIAQIPEPTEANVILHFRAATTGKVCPENCHPFPLSNSRKALRALSLETPVAIAHNGIITSMGVTRTSEFSDTQIFIKEWLVGLGLSILNKRVQNLIGKAASGKFAMLTPEKLYTIGEFTEEHGLFYSNMGFQHSSSYTSRATVFKACDICGRWGEARELVCGVGACRFCFYSLNFEIKNFSLGDWGMKKQDIENYKKMGTAEGSGFGVHNQQPLLQRGLGNGSYSYQFGDD